ncbi:glycosyltransferase [Effusibacillus consociatus]|uniref:Glycosyltransferase n=1 Tax=Effusibacillus consociatus TaxID=1117041 RepID=A0ABV9PZB5_9BACL
MIKGLTSIVVIAFNNLHYTRLCVESVLRHTKSNYELILVDNGCTDGTRNYFEELVQKHPHIKTVFKETNYGSCARNFGFELAEGEFVAILDNDVEVGEDWLTPLLEPFKDETIGGVGHEGVLLDENFGIRVHTVNLPLPQVNGIKVDLLTGYCCVYRNLFKRIGYFDWGYSPFWNEEADFSLRIKSLGYSLLAKATRVLHYAHRTGFINTDGPIPQMTRNTNYFMQKWLPYKEELLELYRSESYDGLNKIKTTPFRLEIGAGDHPLPGYLHLDIRPLPHIEFVADARQLPFGENSVDEIAAYNILEHIPRKEVIPILTEWLRVLRPGGFVEIFGPNLHSYVKAYVERMDGWDFNHFETWVYGHEDYKENFHRVGFSVESLTQILYQSGFTRVHSLNGPDDQATCIRAFKG